MYLDLLASMGIPLRLSELGGRPVNSVKLGRISTIHENKKVIIEDNYLYEDEYIVSKPFDLSKKRSHFIRQTRFVSSVLKKSPINHEIEEALIRYTDALDRRNWHDSCLELWSLLEFLSGGSYSIGNSEKTIKRSASVYKDRELALSLLNYLRDRRNRFVHLSQKDRGSKVAMYVLKGFVERVIRLYQRGRFFKSRDEVAQFLDLPHKKDRLDRWLELGRAKVKFVT